MRAVHWYQFQFNGERIQESAQTGNKDAARQIEAAHRVRLAKGEAGIVERPPAPILKEFSPRFESAIVTLCAEKPATGCFYKEKLRRLLDDKNLCGLRLNAIDEAVIDGYKQRRTRQASRAVWPAALARVCEPGTGHTEAFIAARSRVEGARSSSAHPPTPWGTKPRICPQPSA